MAKVGVFAAADSRVYPRDTAVICRTSRGLEQGTVICDVDHAGEETLAGTLLRKTTPDDQRILDRLDRYRDKAFFACQDLIQEHGFNAVLMDVEHLFDGESVYFYFLGEVHPELESLTDQLAATYDRKVRFKKFAETLANGCGPDCGTKEGSCGGCNGCALANACKSEGSVSPSR